LKGFDARAGGLPIVASDVAAVRDHAARWGETTLVPSDDVAAWSRAIAAAAARPRVVNARTWLDVARAWVDRRRVVDALRADIAQARARLTESLPRIEAAAERRVSTVLLSAAQSPGLQLDGIDRMRRVVEHLGGQVDEAQIDADARRVEAQVFEAQTPLIRVQTVIGRY
jgi:hypothetical protein